VRVLESNCVTQGRYDSNDATPGMARRVVAPVASSRAAVIEMPESASRSNLLESAQGMHGTLSNASLARIPADALGLLGRLRALSSVEVREDGPHVWVRWNEAGFDVLRALLPVGGAQFYEKLDTHWHLCGHSLPAFDIPAEGFRPLAGVLAPSPPRAPATVHEPAPRVVLALKRGGQPRTATAMMCGVRALARWADLAPSREFRPLSAAFSDGVVLLTGQALPPVDGERFWGDRLLCPLGWAPEPALPESALLEAIGVTADELALLRGGEVEIIPRAALRPLTRSSARLAARTADKGAT
jgi:hypothetical protein